VRRFIAELDYRFISNPRQEVTAQYGELLSTVSATAALPPQHPSAHWQTSDKASGASTGFSRLLGSEKCARGIGADTDNKSPPPSRRSKFTRGQSRE
jgi:hypothetical protein